MSRNSSATVTGGAGGRGTKASVSSLQGLRSILGSDTEKDSAPITPVTAAPLSSSEPPAETPDNTKNKRELQGLNNRLQGYLEKVNKLKKKNNDLQEEIDDILAKREAPEGREWNKIQEPLDDLEKEIKELTKRNARLLLLIESSKLTLEDYEKRQNKETEKNKESEKYLENLKKEREEIKQSQEEHQDDIKIIKEVLESLKKEHKEEVNDLREKIINSEVKVEIEPQKSNLSEIVKDMREHYEKVAEKNLKETEEWYKNKFENIKEKEAKNTEALEAGNKELKNLQKELKSLEMEIISTYTRINTIEENVRRAKQDNNIRLAPLNDIIIRLEEQLKEVKADVQQKGENYKKLLGDKRELEKETQAYNKLMNDIPTDAKSTEKA